MTFDLAIRSKFSDVQRGRDDLHSYQRDKAIPFLLENPFSGLFIDMGLGKTICSATVVSDLLAAFEHDKCLVIGPLRVATETWPTEFRLWQHTAWLNTSLIHVMDKLDDEPELKAQRSEWRLAVAKQNPQTPQERAKLMREQEMKARVALRQKRAKSSASVHIISRDWVEWLVDFYGPNWPYRMVIIDESSGFKDHKSNRFKSLAKVRNTPGLIERMHILTATPAAETYEHLFAQIFLIDRGERFGKSISKFRDKYFTYNQWSRKYKIRDGAESEILSKIADVCLVMQAKDYLPMEEPQELRRPVHLNARETELYRTLEAEFVVTLDDGTVIEAETAAVLSSKLLQLSSGVLYETVEETIELDNDDAVFKRVKKVHSIHEHKIEELKQIVEELEGKNILVAYHFKSSLDRLKKAFPKAVQMDKDGAAVKPWNAGKIKMLLMHPQSGGHGLNLQKGAHHIVFFDLPWSLELYLQFIGRLARQGQTEKVFVHLLTAIGTIDEMVYAALKAKNDAQEKLFGMLKRMIAKYRKKKLLELENGN